MAGKRHAILIVDDAEVDRALLVDILQEEYTVAEAASGAEALSILARRTEKTDLILLDMVMPHMDGLELLARLRATRLLTDIPVVMITAEESPPYLDRAYNLGVAECIVRPFNGTVVRRRVRNILLLASRQRELRDMITHQIQENDKNCTLIMGILGSIVEARNGRSGLHVLRIRHVTRMLLETLSLRHQEYELTPERITQIVNAAPLLDIGKMMLPLDTLRKPSRLTLQERRMLRTHTTLGAELMERLKPWQKEPLILTARDICRWHHERYDGSGYPDGLKGEVIPISAQVVALADVYSTLTGPWLQRPAFPHERAMKMILSGECGMFHPALIKCLVTLNRQLAVEASPESICQEYPFQSYPMPRPLLPERRPSLSERTVFLLEQERTKYQFFASLSHEILFEYDVGTDTLSFPGSSARKLGVSPIVTGLLSHPEQCACLPLSDLKDMRKRVLATSPEEPVVSHDYLLKLPDGSSQWHKVTLRTLWSRDEPPRCISWIGNMANIHSDIMEREHLRFLAQRDCLTDLFNRETTCRHVNDILNGGSASAALLIFDVDDFKSINDSYGHAFGDSVLKFVAARIQQNIRRDDMAARIGGDEFLIFLWDIGDSHSACRRIHRLYDAISAPPENYQYSVSMGVALCPRDGDTYDILFRCADQALYAAKQAGKCRLAFYKPGMNSIISRPDLQEHKAGWKLHCT
ncbi:MAG: diguanylate cyclase [Intestinimonas sp.]|jgi:putative two-component system response regulator|nr:diguanylate cyclase [Intestinimonas sp.]